MSLQLYEFGTQGTQSGDFSFIRYIKVNIFIKYLLGSQKTGNLFKIIGHKLQSRDSSHYKRLTHCGVIVQEIQAASWVVTMCCH